MTDLTSGLRSSTPRPAAPRLSRYASFMAAFTSVLSPLTPGLSPPGAGLAGAAAAGTPGASSVLARNSSSSWNADRARVLAMVVIFSVSSCSRAPSADALARRPCAAGRMRNGLSPSLSENRWSVASRAAAVAMVAVAAVAGPGVSAGERRRGGSGVVGGPTGSEGRLPPRGPRGGRRARTRPLLLLQRPGALQDGRGAARPPGARRLRGRDRVRHGCGPRAGGRAGARRGPWGGTRAGASSGAGP